MSLVNDSLKFTSSNTQICWNFLLKKNVSAKATHIFSAKNIRILYIESAKTVHEMTLNELVKLTTLWTTGPWCARNDILQRRNRSPFQLTTKQTKDSATAKRKEWLLNALTRRSLRWRYWLLTSLFDNIIAFLYLYLTNFSTTFRKLASSCAHSPLITQFFSLTSGVSGFTPRHR